MQIEDAFVQLHNRCLSLLYTHRGYEQYSCNSCGALAAVDYEHGVNVKLEPHSPNCPIGTLLTHIKELKLDD